MKVWIVLFIPDDNHINGVFSKRENAFKHIEMMINDWNNDPWIDPESCLDAGEDFLVLERVLDKEVEKWICV